jgi:hypothetical protein
MRSSIAFTIGASVGLFAATSTFAQTPPGFSPPTNQSLFAKFGGLGFSAGSAIPMNSRSSKVYRRILQRNRPN